MAAERVQHDLHKARCACGRTHVAPRPVGMPDSALSIGHSGRDCRVVAGDLAAEMAGPVGDHPDIDAGAE